MPYDPQLAERIRNQLTDVPGLVERKMFGGVGWTIHGNMATGAHSDGNLMIRCSREDFPATIALPGALALMRGKTAMTGWVLVEAAAVVDDAALATWVQRGRAYAESLPAK